MRKAAVVLSVIAASLLSCPAGAQGINGLDSIWLHEASNSATGLTMNSHYISLDIPWGSLHSSTFSVVSDKGLQTVRMEDGSTWNLLFNSHYSGALHHALILYKDAATYRVYDDMGDRSPFFGPLDRFAEVKASSSLQEGGTSYGEANLSDFSLGRPWAVRENGGVGAYVDVSMRDDLRQGRNLQGLVISSGFVSAARPDLYAANSRPRLVEIASSDAGFDIQAELEDTPLLQFVTFPRAATDVRLTVKSVYAGAASRDLCVNFIGALVTETTDYLSLFSQQTKDGFGFNNEKISLTTLDNGEEHTDDYAYRIVSRRPLVRMQAEDGTAYDLLYDPNFGRSLENGLIRYKSTGETEAFSASDEAPFIQPLDQSFSVTVSSFLTEGKTSYNVDYLTDFDLEHPWAVRQNGGVGAVVTIQPQAGQSGKQKIHSLLFSNGFLSARNPGLWEQNRRVKDVTIASRQPAFTLDITLADHAMLQFVNLPEPSDTLTVTVRSVYPGTKYKDLCLSFLAAWVH
ncbi:MAG TPA: hypothetical protein VFI08_03035 [Spirochaetia bacterium]|nr:hypothetical protein [Spirochaetia bacterium]